MISEFAFTPCVFDEAAHKDRDAWLGAIRELGSSMFPKTSVSAVMVSNLHAGSWQPEIAKVVAAIKDHSARMLCQSLLTKIAEMLVVRPAMCDWPGDECGWGKEAIDSAADEPIERIIASEATSAALAAAGHHAVRRISEVHDNGFWKDIISQWSQSMIIADQVNALRKLSVHSEFLCIITPYIRTMKGGDTDFAFELIKSALRRPDKYSSPEIEIHTEAPEDPDSSDYPKRLQSVVTNICTAIRPAVTAGRRVRLVLWPKLLDRFVIAGVNAKADGGKKVRSPRWGVNTSHIARFTDGPASPPTQWSLLERQQLGDVFGRYCTGNLDPNLPSAEILG